MGRPRGMRKINGVWMTVEQQAMRGISADPIIYTPVVTQSTHKTPGVHVYNHTQVKAVELATGLVYSGSFATGSSAELIPVFLKPRSEDDNKAIVAKIRMG